MTIADLVIACEQFEQELGIAALLDALKEIVAPSARAPWRRYRCQQS
jgi:hypothetical protein